MSSKIYHLEVSMFVFVVALGTLLSVTAISSKASTDEIIPQKVTCVANASQSAIYSKPESESEITGFYVYSGHNYEYLGDCNKEFMRIMYTDDYGNDHIGYCRKEAMVHMRTALAIDISHHQEEIDFEKLSRAKYNGQKVEYVMMKLGQTSSDESKAPFEDHMFEANIEKAQRYGLKVGAYIYSKATTVEQSELEAIWVINKLDKYEIEAPVVFDYEDSSLSDISAGVKTEICKVFLDKVQEAGYNSMLYSCQNFLKSRIQLDELMKYNLWVARDSSHQPTISNCNMWQFTSSGQLDGINGDVDMNWIYAE